MGLAGLVADVIGASTVLVAGAVVALMVTLACVSQSAAHESLHLDTAG